MSIDKNTAEDLFIEACQQLIGIQKATANGVWRHVLSSLTEQTRSDIARQIGVDKLTSGDLRRAFEDTSKFSELKRFDADLFARAKLSNGLDPALFSALIKKVFFRSLENVAKPTP